MSKFDQFVEDLGKKVHDLSADDLKIGLSDVAPSASNTVWANITEITPGNGYTAGGSSLSITSYSQTAGLAILIVADLVFTATADSIGPFRYIVFYNNTPTSPLAPLIAWWDNGSEVTLNNTDTFTCDFDQINGLMATQ